MIFLVFFLAGLLDSTLLNLFLILVQFQLFKVIYIPQDYHEDKFVNLQESILDKKAAIQIQREGNFTLSDKTDVENARLFSGEENVLIMSRFYRTKFVCK